MTYVEVITAAGTLAVVLGAVVSMYVRWVVQTEIGKLIDRLDQRYVWRAEFSDALAARLAQLQHEILESVNAKYQRKEGV